jgi:hypothetical protein
MKIAGGRTLVAALMWGPLLGFMVGMMAASGMAIVASQRVEAAAEAPQTSCNGTCPTVGECLDRGGITCSCSGAYPGTSGPTGL